MSAILLTRWGSPHPPDCPIFDYESHPQRQTILPTRVSAVLVALVTGAVDSRATTVETRPLHSYLFSQLTPAQHDYFAGHYRGEPFRCLRHYEVGIPRDPRVGVPAAAVAYWLGQLTSVIQTGLDAFDSDFTLSRRDRLRYLIVFACRVFELFLRIHPYANGNGHAARFIVWCVLGRYGHWPRRWSVEPKPPDPPYSDFIRRYRDGDKTPLEQFVTSMLLP